MRDRCYILGSSADLANLNGDFYDNNVTIGINRAYIRSDELDRQMDYWIAHDRYLAMHPWVQGRHAPDTNKYIRFEYYDEPIAVDYFKKVEAGKREDHLNFYMVRPATDFLFMPGRMPSGLTILDDMGFTIFTAISLAILQGFKDIRFRGVSLKGGYYGQQMNEDRVCYHGPMLEIFEKIKEPLMRDGIMLRNETKDAEAIFEEYT